MTYPLLQPRLPDAAESCALALVMQALADAPSSLADGFDGNPDRRCAAALRIAARIADQLSLSGLAWARAPRRDQARHNLVFALMRADPADLAALSGADDAARTAARGRIVETQLSQLGLSGLAVLRLDAPYHGER